MAMVLARSDFRFLGVLRSLVLLPLVLPPVVGGLALLYTFGRRGLLGESLDALGIQIAFSTIAVVMAQTFVALPFLVVSLEGALRTAGDRYEVAAASLGASPTTVFRRITLPLVMPGLISGSVLAFARALGEFGATITFAGSLQGRTRTLPLEIYLQRETDPDAAVALALVLLVVAVMVIGFARQGRGVAVTRPPQRDACPSAASRRPSRSRDGETLALLGPNGSGKSTLLGRARRAWSARPPAGSSSTARCSPTSAPVAPARWSRRTPAVRRCSARTPCSSPTSTRSRTSPSARAAAALPASTARADAQRWLDEVGVGDLAHRRPRQLSGGQAQRVAVARALAAEPRVLLLDEPMAALDVAVQPALRQVLRRVLADRTAIVVTHDPLDALLLADRVVVLESGRVVEAGPEQGRARPARAARSPGGWPGSTWCAAPGATTPSGPEGSWSTASSRATRPREGEPAIAAFRPQAVAVYREEVHGSPRNAFPVTVTEVEPRADLIRVHAGDLAADVTVQAAADLELVAGSRVTFTVKATEVAVYGL